MTSMGRRRFLQTAATGAAFVSLGRSARAASPSDRVVLGIMGLRVRGGQLAKAFLNVPGCKLAYLCDVDEQVLAKVVRETERAGAKGVKAVKDYGRILEDPAVDALVVATPDHWHAYATIMACRAGKHVYVEKPTSHNGGEGELMVAAARKYDRVVQVGTQRRSSRGMKEAMGRLRSGELGRVLYAYTSVISKRGSIGHGKLAPVPKHLDYDLWQGPAPLRPYRDNVIHYNWHWFWHWGTGEMGNNGIHVVDLCRWGLGVDYPTRVICDGGKFFFDDDQETPDTQTATFHFGDKAITCEVRTWHGRPEGESSGVTFYGDGGLMRIGLGGSYTIYDVRGKKLEEKSLGGGDHYANFLDCIRSGRRPNADIETGVISTALCHLGNIAYRTGQTVRFDPEKRQIVGHSEAVALWSREYRPGWEPKV